MDWTSFVGVMCGMWLVAGPAALGGPANYVVVDGNSMEPTYSDGDLVITRQRADHRIGDVITYLPDVAGQPFPVIHRIVARSGDGYVTQGDNRSEIDGWIAHDDNILGASWLRVPHGGSALLRLRQPSLWLAAALTFLALGLLARRNEVRQAGTGSSR